ncbi:MAG: putative signal transducing protein [Bacteroidota bacterium]
MENMVKIATLPNDVEAHLAQATLSAARIESFLKIDDVGGMFPFLETTEGIELLVAPEDVEEATNLLTKESHPSEDLAV